MNSVAGGMPIAGSFRYIAEGEPRTPLSHVRDNVLARLGTFDFGGAFHEAREIVGDTTRTDSAVEPANNHVGDFGPTQITEHHLAAEHDAAGIDLVLVGVFRSGAVGRLEDSVAGDVIDISTGG